MDDTVSMSAVPPLIHENIPLAPFSSMKVGGLARYYFAPQSLVDLKWGLSWAETRQQNIFVLGNGSNIVFSDWGFNGLIIHLTKSLSNIQWNNNIVIVEAGAKLSTLTRQSLHRGLSGIQRLIGIPGTVGGGTYINAGAFQQELGQSIIKVISYTPEGDKKERNREQCCFGYRHSVFCDVFEIIVEVHINLCQSTCSLVKTESKEILEKRKVKQPLNFPSAGSMFKRPKNNYAGTLIEKAGLKGLQIGGAQVSEKHANFIINIGNAKAQDIYNLKQKVINEVAEKFGVMLENEVRFIGKFTSQD